MKMKPLIFVLSPIIILCQLPGGDQIVDLVLGIVLGEVQSYANEIYQANNISQSCLLTVRDTFNADKSNREKVMYYLNKALRDSSHTKSDVTTFNSCMKYKYEYTPSVQSYDSKPIFLITILDFSVERLIASTEYKANWHMFGLCAPKGCNETEYKAIIYRVLIMLEKPFNVTATEKIQVYSLDNHLINYDWTNMDIVRLIPVIIIIIHFIFICCGCFPFFLFERCFTTRNENLDRSSQLLQGKGVLFNRKKFVEFKSIFNISTNAEQLFFYKNFSKINNDSGLSFLKGIQGIAMIFTIFGTSFFVLYNNPAAIYSPIHFIELCRNFLFGIFYFGLRYAPRILFSCSGFTLLYKMMCYLDEKVEEQIAERKREEANEVSSSFNDSLMDKKKKKGKGKEDDEVNGSGNARDSNDLLAEQLEEDDEDEYKREVDDTKLSFLLQFYAYQLPKYFLLLLIGAFCLYSLYPIVLLVKNIDPMWYYFKVDVLDINLLYLIKGITMVTPFFFQKNEQNKLFNFFWPIYNEMFFFIFTPLLIFIGYKFKAKVDYFIYLVIAVILILKPVMFYVNRIPAVDDLGKELQTTYYSTLYFYFDYYGQMFVNPFYNYIYYLIGVLFGMINYSAQKDINMYEAERRELPFMDKAAKQLNFFKKRNINFFFAFGFLTFFIIILLCILTPLILQFTSQEELIENNLSAFLQNEALNWFMLFDCEIVVFLIHFIVIAFYIKGNNSIIDFFSVQGWSVLSKCYYSFILVMSPVMLYVFYQSETRINFDLPNNCIFAFICGVLVFICATLLYICFELPYKKFVKLLFEKTNEDDYINLIPGTKVPPGKLMAKDD